MGNKARHDFRANTIEVLAKRVGYFCSNPACKSSTVGPGGTPDSIIKFWIAAHITAASLGGPRYDPNLSKADRISIENGIWLCSNCSILIDKDPKSYTTPLLLKWKEDTENEAFQKIKGRKILDIIPRIQPDLIWSHSIRMNNGFSEKNKEKFRNGPYHVGLPLIMHWGITSEFILHIFNNSTKPAFNIKVESEILNVQIDPLRKVNNLPPLEKLELGLRVQEFLEGNHLEAGELMKPIIPSALNMKTIRISYEDESGNRYSSSFEFTHEGLRLVWVFRFTAFFTPFFDCITS